MKSRKELVHDLNDFLERNYDAVQGYKDAARNVKNENLRNFFISQAKKRLALAAEMKAEIKRLGGVPVTEGSFLGIFQRSWVNFKTSLNHENEREVCEACITAEKKAIGEYDLLLRQGSVLSEEILAELEIHKTFTADAVQELETIKEKF